MPEFFDSDNEPVFDESGLLDESDDPALEDMDEDDSWSELVPCPNCSCDIYEELVRCPECGEYVTHSVHPFSGRPWWWIVLGLIGIVATIYLLARI